MSTTSSLWLFILFFVFSTGSAVAEVPASSEASTALFEAKIRPVLIEQCYSCHSATSKIVKGNLLLDTREGIRAGGDLGPAVVPGNPKASLILRALRYDDADLQMPPKGKLSKQIVRDFERWIELGAPDPRESEVQQTATPGIDLEKGREFWAFRPVLDPAAPDVQRVEWCRSDLDRFILAGLESKGLSPAVEATKRELIRRMTFDLTGLPPSPEEVGRFLDDDRIDAYERLVESLLSSPRYGERWGRHWLDVARYADSNGLDENIAYSNAFRYRDWVIDAFNEDLPYDHFVRDQLAGDLIAESDEAVEVASRRKIATGFLSIGPKMLACDDGRKMELDIVDEQVDTTSRAFMAMTMGCARCHDHKFDPLPTKDYYALAGIFKSTKTMENFNVVAHWHEHEVPTPEYRKRVSEFERELASLKEARAQATREAAQRARDEARERAGEYFAAAVHAVRRGKNKVRVDGSTPVGDIVSNAKLDSSIAKGAILKEAEAFDRGTMAVDDKTWGKGIGILFGSGYAEHDFEVSKAGFYQLELRYAAQDRRPMSLSIGKHFKKSAAVSETTGSWGPETQKWFVEGVVKLSAGKHTLRFEITSGPASHIDKFLIIPVTAEGGATPLQSELLKQWIEWFSNLDPSDARWSELFDKNGEELVAVVNSYRASFERATAGAADAELAVVRAVLDDAQGPLRLGEQPTRFFLAKDRVALGTLDEKRKALEKAKPVAPRAMGVREGKIEDLRVHLRGSYLTLGEPAPRGVPRVMSSKAAVVAPGASGRAELASWLTRREHPLTARVMVNRVWQGHFAHGLVRSPDNFGRLGERPTHPALLDWLASRFVDDAWSIKSMHRRILLSSTYRMSTEFSEQGQEADPENRLLWRFPRRRLSAEEVRDSILKIGGSLDLEMYGQLMPDKNRGYVTGTGSKQGTYNFNRRSVYLPILRSAVYQVLQTFDFADPSVLSGERASTTVTPQALYMMNGSELMNETERLARRVMKIDDEAARIRRLYELCFARRPSDAEVDRMLQFAERYKLTLDKVKDAERELRKWQGVVRVLVAANEFIYLD